MPEIIKNMRKALKDYRIDRVDIGKKTIRSLESRIRTGDPVLAEWSIPVGLSAQFGEKSKQQRITAIRGALGNFERYKKFSERRFFKDSQ